jgi:hypothetical protein
VSTIQRNILFIVVVIVAWTLVDIFGNNDRTDANLKNDSEILFVLCSMLKTDILSARIAENTIMLRQSFGNTSEVEIEKKREYIEKAVASAQESALMYNTIAGRYTQEQLEEYNLPKEVNPNADIDTSVKCTYTKQSTE